MADKLSARTEITSGLTANDLMHLVNAGASWKLKLSTLASYLFGSANYAGSFTTLAATGAMTSTLSSGTALSHTQGTVTGVWTASSGGSSVIVGATSNHPTNIYSNNATVGAFSSTGLAVTGVVNSKYNGATGVLSWNLDDTSGTQFVYFAKGNGTTIGSIARVTTTDAVVYNTTSDGRLKTNIRDFTAADSGRIIDGLQPRWFDWKPSDLTETVEETVDSGKVDDKGEHVMEKRAKQQKVTDPARIAKHVADNQSHVGFVAQEEAAIDPLLARIGAVTVGDDDPDNITKQWQRSDSALVPILVAEIKSLRARVAVLEV